MYWKYVEDETDLYISSHINTFVYIYWGLPKLWFTKRVKLAIHLYESLPQFVTFMTLTGFQCFLAGSAGRVCVCVKNVVCFVFC